MDDANRCEQKKLNSEHFTSEREKYFSLETSQPLYIKKARALFDQSAERSKSKESKTLFTRSSAVQFPRRAKILWEGSNAIVLNSFQPIIEDLPKKIFSFLEFL